MGNVLAEGKESKEIKIPEIEDFAEISEIAAEAMSEKKANDIVGLNLVSLSKSIFDEFIIASADSSVQVRAVADNVEEKLYSRAGIVARSRQGDENAVWIVLDYNRFVVHVFRTDCREYYKLEDLWADAEIRHYRSSQE